MLFMVDQFNDNKYEIGGSNVVPNNYYYPIKQIAIIYKCKKINIFIFTY